MPSYNTIRDDLKIRVSPSPSADRFQLYTEIYGQ
jgi:hypothetical protein